MNHKPIQFHRLGLIYSHKICFNSAIYIDEHTALISHNGPSCYSSIYPFFANPVRIDNKYQIHQEKIYCFNDGCFLEVIPHD